MSSPDELTTTATFACFQALPVLKLVVVTVGKVMHECCLPWPICRQLATLSNAGCLHGAVQRLELLHGCSM